MSKFNPFHLVTPRPWPILTSLGFLRFALGVIIIVRTSFATPFLFSLLLLLASSYL